MCVRLYLQVCRELLLTQQAPCTLLNFAAKVGVYDSVREPGHRVGDEAFVAADGFGIVVLVPASCHGHTPTPTHT